LIFPKQYENTTTNNPRVEALRTSCPLPPALFFFFFFSFLYLKIFIRWPLQKKRAEFFCIFFIIFSLKIFHPKVAPPGAATTPKTIKKERLFSLKNLKLSSEVSFWPMKSNVRN
jgi:hypothetical protein